VGCYTTPTIDLSLNGEMTELAIMDYPATVQGCFYNGVVTAGACTNPGGTAV